MNKKVLENDLRDIKSILDKTLNTTTISQIERLGGLTNRTYKVVCENDQVITIRIPGEGTSDMICREDERKSTELACGLGIDTELLYFGEDGTKIMHYIENAETMSAKQLREEDKVQMIADIFRTLHNCGKDTGVSFDVFEMAVNYERVIEKHGIQMYDDYQEVKNIVMKIKNMVDARGTIEKVPCHNDSLCENWIYGEGKLFLIDWEYAGMNDAMWDLADISIEADYSEEQDMDLLKKYFCAEPTIYQKQRFMANKLYLDYLWTLWGKTRVPFSGDEMEQYAKERYIRLKRNIKKFEKLESL